MSTQPQRRKKKPLPLRERLRRFGRELRAAWPLYLFFVVYAAVLFLVAIDPLVSPHMPDAGRNKILAALPLSYHLLGGGRWQYLLFGLVILPLVALLAWLPRLPRWLREKREWERKAVIRRARDKERRARRRAGREANAAKGGRDAPN